MMRGVLAAALMAFPGVLVAQERMTAEACADTAAVTVDLMGLRAFDTPAELADDGWCVVQGARFNMTMREAVVVDDLRWRMSDAERLTEDGLPPPVVEIVGQGARAVPRGLREPFEYLYAVAQSPNAFEFGVGLRWDALQNTVTIDNAHFSYDEGNLFRFDATLSGVDLEDMAAMQTSLGTAALSDLRIRAEFDGWFERELAVPIGEALLEAEDLSPEAQVVGLQKQAIGFIAGLPDDLIPPQSKDALSEFIAVLPYPRGSFQVQMSADPGLGALQMMPLMAPNADLRADLVETVLQDVTILVSWSGGGAP